MIAGIYKCWVDKCYTFANQYFMVSMVFMNASWCVNFCTHFYSICWKLGQIMLIFLALCLLLFVEDGQYFVVLKTKFAFSGVRPCEYLLLQECWQLIHLLNTSQNACSIRTINVQGLKDKVYCYFPDANSSVASRMLENNMFFHVISTLNILILVVVCFLIM